MGVVHGKRVANIANYIHVKNFHFVYFFYKMTLYIVCAR